MTKKTPHYSKKEEEINFIIKKVKDLLNAQYKNITQYLNLLEKEKHAILKDEVEKISAYIELEETYNASITSDSKVLLNWRKQYDQLTQKPLSEIVSLTSSLQDLQNRAYKSNLENKVILKEKLKVIKKELDALRIKSFNIHSPYNRATTPNFLDITS